MAERKPSILLPVILIVVVLVGAGVGGGFLYEFQHPKPTPAPWTVSIGSNVTVNYIGSFGSGPQEGKIFDTSIYAIATNNVTYPKALSFSYRGSEANYTPLGVSVGPNVPSSGYTIDNITFGGVVTGFWQGLLGLQVGQTRTVTFGASQGYGAANPSCFVTTPLFFTVPVLVAVTPSDFSTLYPGVNATGGTHFTDPTYGWPDIVLAVNSSAVVVEHLPSVGWTVPGASWPIVVTAVNATTIGVKNELAFGDVGNVAGTVTGSGVCGATTYIVSALNLSAGTYTQDFNRQVVGQSLTFTVTIVAKYSAS